MKDKKVFQRERGGGTSILTGGRKGCPYPGQDAASVVV